MTTFLQISIDDDGSISTFANPDIVLSETLMDQLVRHLKKSTQLSKETTAEYLSRQIATFAEINRQQQADKRHASASGTPDIPAESTPDSPDKALDTPTIGSPDSPAEAIPGTPAEAIPDTPADALDSPAEIIRDIPLRNNLYFLHRAMLSVDPQLRRRPTPYQGPNPQLANALQLWRREKAKAVGLPAYIILHQRVLYGIADAAPLNKEQLLAISGFGPGLFARYGEEILQLVIQTLEDSQEEL